MNAGKAYDKKKLNKVAMAFKAFRVANNISLPNVDDF
jgi:hypothetical protein